MNIRQTWNGKESTKWELHSLKRVFMGGEREDSALQAWEEVWMNWLCVERPQDWCVCFSKHLAVQYLKLYILGVCGLAVSHRYLCLPGLWLERQSLHGWIFFWMTHTTNSFYYLFKLLFSFTQQILDIPWWVVKCWQKLSPNRGLLSLLSPAHSHVWNSDFCPSRARKQKEFLGALGSCSGLDVNNNVLISVSPTTAGSILLRLGWASFRANTIFRMHVFIHNFQ